MNTLTVKVPEALEAALRAASERRHVSKSALVREALEKALADEIKHGASANRWLSRWRGSLSDAENWVGDDARAAHLIKKHLH